MDSLSSMRQAWPHIASFSRTPNVVAAIGSHQRFCVDASRAPTRATSLAAGPLLAGSAASNTANTAASPCFSIWANTAHGATRPAAGTQDLDATTAQVVRMSMWWWCPRYHGNLKVCVAGLSTLDGQFDDIHVEPQAAPRGAAVEHTQRRTASYAPTALSYNGCSKLSNIAALAVVGRTLQSLDLSQTSIRDGDLAAVANCLQALKNLNLSQCKALTDINCLECVTSLTALYFSNCLSITDGGIARLVALNRLEVVAMNVCKLISSVAAFSASPALRELSCSCTKLMDAGIQQLEQVPSLRIVVFSVSPRITDVRRALAASFNLHRLSLNGTDVTDVGMSLLGRSAPDLDELSISGCAHITTIAWSPIRLRVLDVSHCSMLSVIDHLGRMDRLEELNLSHIPLVTSVACLASCRCMRSVDISFTQLRTVAAFQGWGASDSIGASLEMVDVEACPIARRHEVVQLFEGMQRASALHWG